MNRKLALLAGTAATALAGWIGWGLYTSWTTERVPYEVLGEVDGVELRRYPTTVTIETTAPDEQTAFRRLVGYLKGKNGADEDVAMTAPVETEPGTGSADASDEAGSSRPEDGGQTLRPKDEGQTLPMTAPVRTDDDEDGVHMSFYLPDEYDYESAPTPTDPDVRLVEHPGRTLAVRSFSWWTSEDRVAKQTEELLTTLSDADVTVHGEPFLLRYDDPRTPPFMRTNEVAVEVRRSK